MIRHSRPKNEECSADAAAVQGVRDAASILVGRAVDPNGGLYVHIPFCFHKCHYCDFYSIVDEKDRQAAFVQRLIEETESLAEAIPIRPRTIFVGGGTPTLLEPDLWERLFDGWCGMIDFSRVCEFTVEANPETVTEPLMRVLVAGGVNRVSLGAQSFDERHLQTLERWHDPASVVRSIRTIRQAGIENINLDLIFGVPGQSLDEWREDLKCVSDLQPTHISCYALTYEPNTPLRVKAEKGAITPISDELSVVMFEATMEMLGDEGFEHYEISNFALPGRRCEHNMNYWRNGDWLALGPSASGHVAGLRWKNVAHLGRYLERCGMSEVMDVEELSHEDSIGEQLMMRLRLIEGVENDWLDTALDQHRKSDLSRLCEQGLLERTGDHTRFTRRGLFVADSVLSELL